MSEPSVYPQFSKTEISRREALVHGFLGEYDLDGLVVFGWSAMGRTAQADVYYLSGYLGFRDNYVLFPGLGEPVLFAQSYNHIPNASEVSFLEDVRWGGVNNGTTIGEELLKRGLTSVGLVGWMPYQQYDSMRRAVGRDAEFKDVTRSFRRLRLEKSDEELEWLRRGASFTDAALQGLADGLRPGIQEFELAECIESSYLSDGGFASMYYIASTPMSEPSKCVPSQVLSNREIGAGDVVTCEISIAYAGYAGQGLRTYTVASEPTPEIFELHSVAEEVFTQVAEAMRPGATTEDVWSASDVIEESGFTIRDGLAHGYGIGLLPPSVRTRQTTHGLDEDWVFRKNQTLVIQPNVVTKDESVGVQIGDLCVITDQGAKTLHRFPFELIRVQ